MFVLVDLELQARAVAAHLRGLSTDGKLLWLQRHGEVIPIPQPPGSREYHGWFRSGVGMRATFALTGEGRLLILVPDMQRRIDPLEQELFAVHWDWRGSQR